MLAPFAIACSEEDVVTWSKVRALWELTPKKSSARTNKGKGPVKVKGPFQPSRFSIFVQSLDGSSMSTSYSVRGSLCFEFDDPTLW